MKAKKRIAVVLCNLGGPDHLENVRPFLYNLFSDAAIIRLPSLARKIIAYFIAKKRTEEAQHIYRQMGGKSPILENTKEQASAVEKRLKQELPDWEFSVYISMRYWHPRSKEVVEKIAASNAEEIIFLPLYPQFSTTTTKSSFEEFLLECKKQGLLLPCKAICCYPNQEAFIAAHVHLISKAIKAMEDKTQQYRLLFSAHGLPENISKTGDPYVWQVEKTVQTVVETLEKKKKTFDWLISYQSRVGPLAWVKPDTEEEIKRAAAERKSLIIVPIAFVSEHSETLVELDITYSELAKELGIHHYIRVPALSCQESYIKALATMIIQRANNNNPGVVSETNGRQCPSDAVMCPCQ